jgi:hypothetical protein
VSAQDPAAQVPGAEAAAVDPATGLRLRPAMPADVLAAVTAAVQQLTSGGPPPAPPDDSSYLAWRFSGRWWHRPLPTRRERPYPSRGG